MTHLQDESNDSNTLSQAWQGQELTRFKQLAVDNAYRKLKNVMHMKKKNLFNPLKAVASLTRFAIHYLFKVIFGIVGVVFAGTAYLPLGTKKTKAVFGTFEMVGSLLEALIVTIIDFIIRMLLSPHWWYTAVTVAREHSTKNNVPFKQGLSMVTVKSFVVIIERALRENFDDVKWQPLSEDHQNDIRAVTDMTILNSPSRFSLADLENEQLLQVEQKTAESDIEWVTSCVICKQYPNDHACIPCGHMVLCNDENCHRGCNKKCPTCRKDIISINRIYSNK